MGLFDIFKRSNTQTIKEQPIEERQVSLNGLMFNSWSSFSNNKAMKLSAVYAATNAISNSCAVLPFEIYRIINGQRIKVGNHHLNSVLNFKPDLLHTHYAFVKQLIESVILKGNAYAIVIRDEKLDVKELRYIDADYVTPMMQEDGNVKYIVAGMSAAVDSVNMIHLYMHVDKNFRGMSLIKYAVNTLEGAQDAETHSQAFYKSGANLSGILKSSSVLNNEQKKQIKDSWTDAFNTNADKVSVAVLPAGVEYQPISISPEDAQLLQSRQYNVIEIARFFNISPVKLFDLSHSSYGSLEQTQLGYLQDTILPYITMMQDEFNLKLFKPSEVGKMEVKMDFSILLSANKETEAAYYKTLVNNGLISIDDARGKLGFTPLNTEASQSLWMQINMGVVDKIAEGAYIKDQAKDQNQDTDKKVTK